LHPRARLGAEQLEVLRDECQHFIDVINAEMDAEGVKVKGINHRDSRYFIARRYKDSEKLRAFLFGDVMEQVVRATLGPDAYLFVEQFVVKMAEGRHEVRLAPGLGLRRASASGVSLGMGGDGRHERGKRDDLCAALLARRRADTVKHVKETAPTT
jgi:hypothetical protein